MESEVLYEKVLFENEEKGFQQRLVVNEFKDVIYLHIRKYFMSYDSGYLPSKEGMSMPLTICNVYALLDGLIDICSNEESIDAVTRHFGDKIASLKQSV